MSTIVHKWQMKMTVRRTEYSPSRATRGSPLSEGAGTGIGSDGVETHWMVGGLFDEPRVRLAGPRAGKARGAVRPAPHRLPILTPPW